MAFTYSYSNLVGTFTGSSGENAGLDISGRPPGSTLKIVGATALASITGYNTGTAGTGTSATSLAKPAGGTNWTAAALPGKLLKATVDGEVYYRQILSNTTTTLAINSIPGLDNTCTFQIVDYDSQVDRISSTDLVALRVANSVGRVEIYALDFSSAHSLDGLIEISDCADVLISGCKLAFNTVNPAVNVDRCNKITIEHCRLTSSSDIAIDGCVTVAVDGCVNAAGGSIEISDCVKADVTKLTAASAPSRALGMTRVNAATAEVVASSCGATPIYLESCAAFTAVGGLLTGTGNTGYGIEIAKSGQYTLTGSTITGGTGDVLFMSSAETWTNLSSPDYGIIESYSGNAVANAAYTKSLKYGAVLFYGEVNFSSRALFYGILNRAQNTGITAAGTTASDAYQLPAGEFYRVDTVAAGTGVKLHNAAGVPGAEVIIHNNGANTLKVYPTSGTINGGASLSVAAGAVRKIVIVDTTFDAWLEYA